MKKLRELLSEARAEIIGGLVLIPLTALAVWLWNLFTSSGTKAIVIVLLLIWIGYCWMIFNYFKRNKLRRENERRLMAERALINANFPDIERILIAAYKDEQANPEKSSFNAAEVEIDQAKRVKNVRELIRLEFVTDETPPIRTVILRDIRLTQQGREYCEYHKLI